MAKISSLKHLYVELAPIPKPEKQGKRSREAWLEDERARARAHLLQTLVQARSMHHLRNTNPQHALESLEEWFLNDRFGLEYERDFLVKLETAQSVLAYLESELHASPFPSDVVQAALDKASKEGRRAPPAMREQAWKRASRWFYDVSAEQVEAISRALAAVEEIRSGIAAEDHPTWHRLTTSTRETPSLERLARQCVRRGLGPREAAMMEAIVEADPDETSTPHLWFDEPTAATKRWRQAYERLAKRFPELEAPPPGR